MRLLLDANLSWRLIRLLENEFPVVTHLIHTGLEEFSSDTTIWNFARDNHYTIVTNDEDFYFLSLSKGFPPKIILLRTGNQSSKYIAGILLKHKSEIEKFTSAKEYGVLEIF